MSILLCKCCFSSTIDGKHLSEHHNRNLFCSVKLVFPLWYIYKGETNYLISLECTNRLIKNNKMYYLILLRCEGIKKLKRAYVVS